MTATSIKISQLPSASTPLTGAEIMPIAKSRQNAKVGIGAVQIPQPLGDLPPNTPVGTLGYVVDAAGGPRPAYSNGTGWQQFGGSNDVVKTMGPGLWVVGVGPCDPNSPAHTLALIPASSSLHADESYFFISNDGQHWGSGIAVSSGPIFNKGITGISYANGCWLFGGQKLGSFDLLDINTPVIATVRNPQFPSDPDDGFILTPPRGYSNTSQQGTPNSPTNYDNDTGIFTVPIQLVNASPEIKLITNTLCAAIVPDTRWPYIGQNGGSSEIPVGGMGINGPAEVRIVNELVTVSSATTLVDSLVPLRPGNYLTDHLEWRPSGASGWQQVVGPATPSAGDFRVPPLSILGGNSLRTAGLSLNGLVWGPVAQRAVLCQPGRG